MRHLPWCMMHEIQLGVLLFLGGQTHKPGCQNGRKMSIFVFYTSVWKEAMHEAESYI